MAEDDPVRIIPHRPDGVADTGSFEVRFADGRPSAYFYWDDIAGRRLRPDHMTRDEALAAARALARAEPRQKKNPAP